MFGVSPITPAYGRDYKNRKDVKTDFNKNLDFVTPMGQYINKAQLKDMDCKSIQVRFSKNKKTFVLEID